MYASFQADGDESRGASSKRFYVGVALSAVVGLMLLGVVALSIHGTSTVQSTDLIGMSTSRFTTRPGLTGPSTIASLPGPRPWKELAIAAMEASNGCDRDVSMNGHAGLKAAMAKMDSQSKALIARASKDAVNTVNEMPGIVAPLGFFDPLGFSAEVSQGKLLFYREVELKHGRVCMLAALGILVAEQFHPLFGGNIDVPAYIAFQETPLEKFWVAVAIAITIPEIQSIKAYKEPVGDGSDYWTIKEDRVPGDLGFDPLGLKPTDPAALLELQNKEILNGRLAMISTAGMIAQELVTKEKIFR
jgi:hypothetical protein